MANTAPTTFANLEHRFLAALDLERETENDDEAHDRALDATGRIVEEIEALPGATADEVRLMAKALVWCNGDYDFGKSTDMRLVGRIARSLTAIPAGA